MKVEQREWRTDAASEVQDAAHTVNFSRHQERWCQACRPPSPRSSVPGGDVSLLIGEASEWRLLGEERLGSDHRLLIREHLPRPGAVPEQHAPEVHAHVGGGVVQAEHVRFGDTS